MTLFLVFDILIHYKYCKFAVMAASASRPCLKPLSLTLCSFHIFSSPYPLAATLFQHDSGMRMLRRKHDAWGCKLHIPFGLDALHFKRVRTQGSLHHILHNVSLLLFFWISSTSEISQDIFSSILFAIADSSSGIPWA